MRFKKYSILALLIALLMLVTAISSSSLAASSPSSEIKVATRIVPPFVIQEGGKLTGFSIELWKLISADLKIPTKFTLYDNIPDTFAAVKSGKDDVAIAAISITEERNKIFDFSQPIYESGLQILVRSQPSKMSLWDTIVSWIFSPVLPQIVALMLALILIPAHIIWFVESRHSGGIINGQSYFPGIFKACWWALSTLATQADEMPKGPIGRIVATFWMFISVLFIAYFTATITSSLTVQQLKSTIQGVDDLIGKKVATVYASTTAEYLDHDHITVDEVKQPNQAYEELIEGKVDAVVLDSPMLLYYAAHEGKGKVEVVGPVFQKENYGILMPFNSKYRKPIDISLLKLQKNGTYKKLYDKWFSTKAES